jgi:hypothetical protein
MPRPGHFFREFPVEHGAVHLLLLGVEHAALGPGGAHLLPQFADEHGFEVLAGRAQLLPLVRPGGQFVLELVHLPLEGDKFAVLSLLGRRGGVLGGDVRHAR